MDSSLSPVAALRPEPARRETRRPRNEDKRFEMHAGSERREDAAGEREPEPEDDLSDTPLEDDTGRSLDVTA